MIIMPSNVARIAVPNELEIRHEAHDMVTVNKEDAKREKPQQTRQGSEA